MFRHDKKLRRIQHRHSSFALPTSSCAWSLSENFKVRSNSSLLRWLNVGTLGKLEFTSHKLQLHPSSESPLVKSKNVRFQYVQTTCIWTVWLMGLWSSWQPSQFVKIRECTQRLVSRFHGRLRDRRKPRDEHRASSCLSHLCFFQTLHQHIPMMLQFIFTLLIRCFCIKSDQENLIKLSKLTRNLLKHKTSKLCGTESSESVHCALPCQWQPTIQSKCDDIRTEKFPRVTDARGRTQYSSWFEHFQHCRTAVSFKMLSDMKSQIFFLKKKWESSHRSQEPQCVVKWDPLLEEGLEPKSKQRQGLISGSFLPLSRH